MIKQIKFFTLLMLAQGLAWADEPRTAASSDVVATAPAQVERVISAGGSISEWLVAMGGQAQLVGVDTTSLHPAALQELPSIGYQRQLAAEGVLTLQPQILFGSEEMGPPTVLEQLRASGVHIETLAVATDLQALRSSVRRMGELTGHQQQAEQALQDFMQAMAMQQQQLTAIHSAAPRVLLVFSAGQGNPLAAGTGTVGDWLIKQAGGENLAVHEGFKALSTESLLALNPQVIIVADRHSQGLQALEAMLSSAPALRHTAAVQQKRVLAIDPTLLVGGLGPRIPEQVAQLMALFYPQLSNQLARQD